MEMQPYCGYEDIQACLIGALMLENYFEARLCSACHCIGIEDAEMVLFHQFII
jgi:hypothetical protein